MDRLHRFIRLLSFASLLLATGSAFAFPPYEGFDEFIAPFLPPGWLNWYYPSNYGGPGWITVHDAFSGPNAAFTEDTPSVTEKFLETPAFPIYVMDGRITFRHKFELESNPPAGEAYDGVALEISFDSEPFVDILTAGGAFAIGGYNTTVSTSFDNPLAGRQVWSGSSGGYQAVDVHLPSSANGRTIRLRWRMGTDVSAGSIGYWLDDIHVYGALVPFPPSETFDEQIAPELPAGWLNVLAAGPGPGWLTVTFETASQPNAAFCDDVATISDRSLETPPFDVLANGRVSFVHRLDLESATNGIAYDGVVLQIAYDGGPFQDFVEVGGRFAAGGYAHTISTCCDNPQGNKAAWGGTSGGYQDVVAILPQEANGKSVRLRWRMSTDNSIGRSGYWLDNIHVDVDGPPDNDGIFADGYECVPCQQ